MTCHRNREIPRSAARGVAALAVLLAAALPSAAGDLLEQMARAREYDPIFTAARLEREIADEILRESRSRVYPLVQATADETKVYQEIISSDNILFNEGESDFFNETFVISLTQPIYRQDVIARIPQAKAEVRQAVALYTAAEQDLMFRVAEAYFGLLAARGNLELAVAERIALQRQLQQVEERLTAGLVTVTDAHDARARFALAQATEAEAYDALEERRGALAEITGQVPEDPDLLGEGFPLVVPDRTDAEAWVETALFQNPTIKGREAAVEAAEQEIRIQRAGRYPTLDLVASWNSRDSGDTFGRGGNDIETTDVSLRLAVPIYEGGRTASRMRAASLRHRVRLQELEAEKRSVERVTRTSFQGVLSGITRVQALQKSVFSGEAAVAARQEALLAGLDTAISLLDARRDLFEARRDLGQARYVYILSGLKLKQATGTLSPDDLEQIDAYLQ